MAANTLQRTHVFSVLRRDHGFWVRLHVLSFYELAVNSICDKDRFSAVLKAINVAGTA
jgi:hypothetical protein